MGDSAAAPVLPAAPIVPEKTEKEKMLDEKMAAMRKRNEEIQRRHDEVEADKINANLLSRMAGLSTKSPSPEKELSPKSAATRTEGKVPKGRGKPKLQVPQGPAPSSAQISPGKTRFSGDGPPPDPKFGFLTDPTRFNDNGDGNEGKTPKEPQLNGHNRRHVKQAQQQQSGFYQPRSHQNQSGSRNEAEAKLSARERRDYVQWKEEREQIDRERLARAQNPSGQWRREWDMEKITDDHNRESTERTKRRNPQPNQLAERTTNGDKQRQRRKSQPRPVDNSRPAQRGERRRSEGPIDDQNVAIERKIRSSPAKVKSNDRTPPQRSTQSQNEVKTVPKAGEIGGKRQRRKKQPPLENVRVTISGEGDRVVEPTDKTAEEWEEVEGNDNDWEEDHAMYGASVIGNDLEDTNFLDETLSSPAAILLMEPSPTDKTNLNQLDLLGMTESFERLPVEQRYTLVVPESIDIGSNRDSLDEIEKEMIAKMNENIEATDAFFDKNDEELELIYGIKPARLHSEDVQVRLVLESLITSVELSC